MLPDRGNNIGYLYENFEIGPFWITISDWDSENIYVNGDISDRRLIEIILPLNSTMEEIKLAIAAKVKEIVDKCNTDLINLLTIDKNTP